MSAVWGCTPQLVIDEGTVHHERAVAEFLQSCDPARLAMVAALWPVLTNRQMRSRHEREIPVGDHRDVEIVALRAKGH